MTKHMLKFDMAKNETSIIKVVGVGGGGSNAVTHMFNQGIKDVDFIICNTDSQAMDISPVPTKLQLGQSGLGAGSIPQVGRAAAEENLEEIKEMLSKNTKMVFVTAGMGGGTGTGAAPVLAKAARELDVLTVGIVTLPFSFEGRKRREQAEEGIKELKQYVDTLLVISNDKLRHQFGNLKLTEAFAKADDVLAIAAKGIAEIITVTGNINVDFEDVKTVMKNSGKAIMGSAVAEGENRAIEAVEAAISSPLLDDNDIDGAKDILLYIASGNDEVSMDEITDITEHIRAKTGGGSDVIWGTGMDESLGDQISITLIATGFDSSGKEKEPVQVKTYNLHDDPQDQKVKEEPPKKEHATVNKIELVNPKKEAEKETTRQDDKRGVPGTSAEEKTQPSSITEPTLLNKEDKETETREDERENEKPEKNEMEIKSRERIKKLREMSIKLRSPKEIAEMENVPAFVRKNVNLSDTPSSSESLISRYSLTDDDDDEGGNKARLKSGNSFLHDNAD